MFAARGDAARFLLIGLTALLTIALVVWAYRSQGWQRVALSVILAGALSNLIDRTTRGAVTDFLGLHAGDWYAFVFNLADVWISIGFVLLLLVRELDTRAVRRKPQSTV